MGGMVAVLAESRLGSAWEVPEPAPVSAGAQRALSVLPGCAPTISATSAPEAKELAHPMSAIGAPRLAGTAHRARRLAAAPALARRRPELLALLVVAAVLDLWGLSRNGWANEYYSAAVRSMSSSWHAFLYGSFDAAGVMTVDKPPLASWLQVAFVKLLGYHPFSLLLPQALMGLASVALVYDLTRRRFGRAAGFVAGLATSRSRSPSRATTTPTRS